MKTVAFGSIALIVLLVVAFFIKKKMSKTPRQMEIEKALKEILKIKMGHHDKIVKALEDGASEEEHTALLNEKEADVLSAIDEVEKELDIVINKENPTEVGPVRLVKDNKSEEA